MNPCKLINWENEKFSNSVYDFLISTKVNKANPLDCKLGNLTA
jgi:hypothetical protein